MPERVSFDYAVVRVVPRVERREFVNAGVIVHCRERAFLGARVRVDDARLAALAPDMDAARVRRQLDLIRRVCEGDPSAGPIARLDGPARFHWLVGPCSSVIQASEVHCGMCADPAAALDDLYALLVA